MPPERKPAIIVVGNNMTPVFSVGEYVNVKGDTSQPGNNLSDGFGFVTKRTMLGVGAAALCQIWQCI